MPVAEVRGQPAPTQGQVMKKVMGKNGEELDPSDPRVKKLVYNMYRDMLTGYRDEASAYVEGQDPSTVTQDYGVIPIIETILRGGGSSSDSGSVPTPSQGGQSSAPGPPPPPPMAPPGAIPAVRLNSEIGPREKGPPAALAGAMMKDKKPFTYTPGGIDLSEIRSPRMAKRLQMNAAAEGVTSTPKAAGEGQGKPVSSHHGPLPPAAQAAMQGQMAFCVFPQGAPPTLNRSHKPHDYTDGDVSNRAGMGNGTKTTGSSGPPPPPPPQQNWGQGPPPPPQQNWGQGPPPPPPPPPMGMPHLPKSRSSPPPQQPPPTSGMHPIAALFRQQQLQQSSPSYEPEVAPEPPTQPPTQSRPTPTPNNVGKGSIYIQPLTPAAPPPPQEPQVPQYQIQYQLRQASPPPPPPRSPQPRHQTRAQVASQALGSIYIPPITPAEMGQPPQAPPPMFSPPQQVMTPSSGGSSAKTPHSGGSTTLPTPQLKKTPTPWMNSHNKMATKSAESPPYVNPGNISTPWGTIPGGNDGSGPGMVYNIPITLAREDSHPGSGGSGSGSPDVIKAKAAQHLGRVIPIQIQRQTSLNKEHQIQAQQEHGWPCPRAIPIQIETRGGQKKGGKDQGQVGSPAPGATSYNTPMGLYSGQNAAEAYAQHQAGVGEGMKNMTIGDQEKEPVQSKSMKIIQKAAENELRRLASTEEEVGWDRGSGWPQQEQGQGQMPYWPQPFQEPSWTMDQFLQDNQNYFNQQQVDEGPFLHNTAEPRFRGGHIPGKAFKTLQTTLPPATSDRVVSPQPRTSKVQVTQAASGPVMHNIPIQMSSSSPTPLQGSRGQVATSPVPPSEQRAPSPKKYMGAHIPGRSFKILQAMTAPEDPDAPSDIDLNASSSPTSGCNLLPGESESLNSSVPLSPSPSPCSSPYVSWYYWWYYVSCYWAGYDMTGYEYPQGWDPNNPYFPPELAGTFPGVDGSGLEIPQIVVEQEGQEGHTVVSQGQGQDYCDSEYYTEVETEDDDTYHSLSSNYKNNATPTPTPKSDQYWTDDEEQAHTNTALVEEPSSGSSYDSDAGTLIEEGVQSPSSLLIEEYFSSSESESSTCTIVPSSHGQTVPLKGGGHFLTTIEELTDECSSSRGSTPLSAGSNPIPVDPTEGEEVDENPEVEEITSSSEEDEASSVSVIENKSASQSQQSFSISKREDETSSSSSSSESSESDAEEGDGVNAEGDGDEDDGAEATAVTVRLPLKLSFGKTKSYKDITTVLVGDVGVEGREDEEVTQDEVKGQEKEKDDEGKVEEECWEEEDDDEPVVSFTISLSRQTSREDKAPEEEPEVEDDSEVMDDNQDEEEEEVDFWSKIVGPSAIKTKIEEKEEITDYWGSFTANEEETKYEEPEEEEQEPEAVQDFWGQIGNSSQKPEVEKAPKPCPAEEPIVIKLGKSPSKIGMSWDTEFNFWDKSLKTIETRRFSGNFEISEDYESDSGMKSDSGQRHRQKKHKVKKYKRHSTPAGLPVMKGRGQGRGRSEGPSSVWGASTNDLSNDLSLQKETPQEQIRQPFSFLWSEDTFSAKLAKMKLDEKILDLNSEPVEEAHDEEPEVEQEEEPEVDEVDFDPEPEIEQKVSQPEEGGADLSAGWSAWEGWDMDKNTTSNDAEDFSSPDVDVQVSLPVPEESLPEESLPVDQEQEEEVEQEDEKPEQEQEEDEDEYEYEYEYEEEPEQEEPEVEEVEVEEVKVPEEKVEESSEDSSKSSGATVKVPGAGETEEGSENTEGNSDESFKSTVTKVEKVEQEVEIKEEDDNQEEIGQEDEESLGKVQSDQVQSVPIKELPESIKLSTTEEPLNQDHTHPTSGSVSNCTCHIDSQLSRAESLLWRIERFLHESLSLGSEDDSGVMTDLSRPISDVDTDPDPDDQQCSPRESSDLLLATSTSMTSTSMTSTSTSSAISMTSTPMTTSTVVMRRPPLSSSRSLREQAASNRANPVQPQGQGGQSQGQTGQPLLRRARPQSLIMLESSIDTEFQEASNSIATAAKTRSRSAERKKYTRAKTHSRLFQLLQDECCTDVEDNDGDGEAEEFFDCEQLLPKNQTPLSFLEVEKVGESKKVEFQTSTSTLTSTSTQLHVDIHNSTSARRSRLLPLPLKGILHTTPTAPQPPENVANPNATTTTSTSSPSGSSGVLSPTSPQTRDRLLADIINEFHLRQKSELGAGLPPGSGSGRLTRLSQSGARFSKFPSKIFKLLQEEFGEEFYQTFELGGEIGQQLSPGDLLSQSHSHFGLPPTSGSGSGSGGISCVQHQHIIMDHSMGCIVKSDSTKSTGSTSTGSDFLEVPTAVVMTPGPLRRRDFRRPKSPFNKNK